MKKSLMLISFAFIFLLSVSVVSANFFDWITGDVQRTKIAGRENNLPTSVSKDDRSDLSKAVSGADGGANTFSRTGSSLSSSARISQTSSRSPIRNGLREVNALGGGKCYIFPDKSRRFLGLVQR